MWNESHVNDFLYILEHTWSIILHESTIPLKNVIT
jgi:hypothetical protein